MTDVALRLHCFGALEARAGDGSPLDAIVAQPKRAALLAYLAVGAPGAMVRRDTLLALFWPESTEAQARRALNQALHFLRAAVGHPVIVSLGADAVGLDAGRTWCDVTEFDAAIRADEPDRALSLHRAVLLEGFTFAGLTEFDSWLDAQRRRRAAQAAGAAWSLAERAAAADDAERALAYATRAHGLVGDEASVRRLVALLDALGDRAAALREYDRFARTLRAEYDALPAPETQALVSAIRARTVASPRPAPAVPAPGRAPSTAPGASATPSASPPASPPPVEAPSAAGAPGPPLGESPLAGAHQSPSRPRPPAWWRRRHGRAAVSFAGLALVATVGWLVLWPRAVRGVTGPAAVDVAVFPFAYRGGQDLGYLGESIASLLSSNLASTADARTVDARALAAATAASDGAELTVAQAAGIAADFGAGLFVVGDVTESGNRLRIDATLYDRSGATPDVRARVEGSSADLFELVDALTRRLMDGRPGNDELYHSAALTTHSIEALRAYLAGEADRRAGRYGAAIQAFRRALDVDSTFALAYYGLSSAANWTGETALAGWAAREAVVHRERLPARDRHRVEAWDAYLRGDVEVAARAYDRLLAESPSDAEAAFHRADIDFHWGAIFGNPIADQGARWRAVDRLDPRNAGVLLHAARVAAIGRDRPWFDSLAARLTALGPEASSAAELRALHAFAFGTRDARTRAADALRLLPEDVRRTIIGPVAAAADPAEAADLLIPTLLFEHTFMSFEDGILLTRAGLDVAAGRTTAARATIDSVMLLNPQRSREFRALLAILPTPDAGPEARRAALAEIARAPVSAGPSRYAAPLRLWLLAMLQLRTGGARAAARAARALEEGAPGDSSAGPAMARRYARIVRAELALDAGRPADALAALGEPHILPDFRLPHVWSYPLAHERYLRGVILEALGRTDDALRWYRTFPDPNAYDFAYLPAVRARMRHHGAAAGAGPGTSPR